MPLLLGHRGRRQNVIAERDHLPPLLRLVEVIHYRVGRSRNMPLRRHHTHAHGIHAARPGPRHVRLSPNPKIPTVCPPISCTSNGSQTAAVWLRTIRRKPFAKYKIAASTNSPSDALNTPRPLVSRIWLSTSSGNKRLSRPAALECIQRNFPHIPNNACSNSREPDHCRITVASLAAGAQVATSPHIVCGRSFSIANCGSFPDANTNTGLSLPIPNILPRYCSKRWPGVRGRRCEYQPECIPGQKSASRKFRRIGTGKRRSVQELGMKSFPNGRQPLP